MAVASWLYSTSAKCGRLRAYEREEDLKILVMQGKKLKAKKKSMRNMKPKFNYITLAVDDLNKSLAFYRDGLGWPTEGVVGSEYHDEVTGADGTIAFFKLEGGILLGLYERENLAKDASIPLSSASSAEFSLGYTAE